MLIDLIPPPWSHLDLRCLWVTGAHDGEFPPPAFLSILFLCISKGSTTTMTMDLLEYSLTMGPPFRFSCRTRSGSPCLYSSRQISSSGSVIGGLVRAGADGRGERGRGRGRERLKMGRGISGSGLLSCLNPNGAAKWREERAREQVQ